VSELILPQFGIFAQGAYAHHFLEFDLHPDVTAAEAVASFKRLRVPEVSAGGVNLVIGFGARALREIAPHLAAGVAEFGGLEGPDGHSAPATPHDAWLWLSASAPDITWEHARAAVGAVADVARLAAERSCFTYRRGRDTTGFIDGTANRPLRSAGEVALVPPDRPGAGGSHVLAMRWIHDLDAFDRLAVAQQQGVIGRTKPDSVELEGADKPPTAHIARVETSVGGHELEIFRRSVPYGTASEYGLYFVAFSADPSRYDRMLARMFGTAGDGVRDRLTDFSRPVSGAYYFAPSLNALNELADA
jgi:putative iron-dependent peroxidase